MEIYWQTISHEVDALTRIQIGLLSFFDSFVDVLSIWTVPNDNQNAHYPTFRSPLGHQSIGTGVHYEIQSKLICYSPRLVRTAVFLQLACRLHPMIRSSLFDVYFQLVTDATSVTNWVRFVGMGWDFNNLSECDITFHQQEHVTLTAMACVPGVGEVTKGRKVLRFCFIYVRTTFFP